ncbi:hypothetical protein GHT09_016906 [Marmota monax]|uniref:Envelope glycoprotein n=1 Tax=Marmota monax TaxID=9995 RepID=A0A834UUL5_MARMO|nr:hypothetical protein GHT09_016906 [Marmota monax]
MGSLPGSMPLILSLRPVQTPAGNWNRLVTLSSCVSVVWVGLWILPLTTSSPNPHQPVQQQWQVINPTGQVIWSISHTAPLWTWWPSLHPDICQLAIGLSDWDLPDIEDPTQIPLNPKPGQHSPRGHHMHYGCHRPHHRYRLASLDYYVCPADFRNRKQARTCGGPSDFYCKSWGCEQTGAAWWKPNSPDSMIQVGRNDTWIHPRNCLTSLVSSSRCGKNSLCNPLNITFTSKARGYLRMTWLTGNTWGMRFDVYGPTYDFGLWFTIQLKQEENPTAIGPNPLKPGIKHPKPPMPRTTRTPLPSHSSRFPSLPTSPVRSIADSSPWELIKGTFTVLNSTQPDLTQSCWLCLSAAPPLL